MIKPRPRRRSRRALAATSIATCLLALLALAPWSAGGADELGVGCERPPVTTNATGTVLYVSPCATDVVVTSPVVQTIYGSSADDEIHAGPNVEAIFGGEGDDAIFAGPTTELIEGGGGEDAIYGEPLENETGGGAVEEVEAGVEYVPAPALEPRASTAEASEAEGEAQAQPAGAVGSTAGADHSPAASASAYEECMTNPCLGGLGSQELKGGEGNDEIFGERGDDKLKGEGGDDALYGGIGDDELFGGPGNDFLAGGPGSDQMSGEEGNDLLRGDGTTDTISGGAGTDTISFATGVTPGFGGAYPSGVPAVSGFPAGENGRGVYVRLDGTAACESAETGAKYAACNGGAGLGGGDDTIEVSEIENVIGTPFADVIVGSSGANKIYGGGGGDVIVGDGGADELFGGGDGDYIEDSGSGVAYGGKGTNNCVGVTTVNECPGTESAVTQPATTTLSAGLMMTTNPAVGHDTAYLIGSEGEDKVNAHYVESGPAVTFTSTGTTLFAGESEGCTYELGGTKATCKLPPTSSALDGVVMAGLAGNDKLTVSGEPTQRFPLTANAVLLGGEGNDELLGSSTTEDVLVDAGGNDVEKAYGYDDWLLNNGGTDVLEGGEGNDLLLSTTVCGGDTIRGGEASGSDGAAQNDASWAKLTTSGVSADLATGTVGKTWNGSEPVCAEGSLDHLSEIDDLEGSSQEDALIGNAAENLLLGHAGHEILRGEAGDDRIEAKDGVEDKVNGGSQTEKDVCIIDLPLDEAVGCELTTPSNATTTTIAAPEAHNGSPGSVTVKGSVAAFGSLTGTHVQVEFEKEESGKWVLKDNDEVALPENGNYTRTQSVGVGSWRVRAVFPAQGDYQASSTAYHSFTIAK
jgi:Ca2+-binding RTX toxin-like protein